MLGVWLMPVNKSHLPKRVSLKQKRVELDISWQSCELGQKSSSGKIRGFTGISSRFRAGNGQTRSCEADSCASSLVSPASWSALEHVAVVEQTVEHSGDGG